MVTIRSKNKIEVYFKDLKEESQRALLEFYGVQAPEDLNWDICPLVTLENPNPGVNCKPELERG